MTPLTLLVRFNMSDDITEGLFKGAILDKEGRLFKHGFFRPIEIVIYSAPPPVRMRVVTYRMLYWPSDKQPVVSDDFNEAKLYVNTVLGIKSFSFTTGTMPVLKPMLLKNIRDHFTSMVLQNKPCRDKDNGVERFRGLNTYRNDHISMEGIRSSIFNVEHRTSLTLTKKMVYTDSSETIFYDRSVIDANGNNISEVASPNTQVFFKCAYLDNRKLAKSALSNLQTQVNKRMI